jgi:hypothetical protein
MEWNSFEESSKEYPESIAEKSIEGFSKATKGLAELKIIELSDMARLSSKVSGDFLFEIRLVSQHIGDYSLKVMTFGYDIELNPIYYILDDVIYHELFQEKQEYGKSMVCENGEEFNKLLRNVYKSTKFKDTVAGLMKIARKRVIEF